jgi:hypothetical protein
MLSWTRVRKNSENGSEFPFWTHGRQLGPLTDLRQNVAAGTDVLGEGWAVNRSEPLLPKCFELRVAAAIHFGMSCDVSFLKKISAAVGKRRRTTERVAAETAKEMSA